jgi:uncharacterized protein YndB with AHSA1/START domain
MTKQQRSITHGSFTLERTFPNETPARVFAAFTPQGKAKWFGGPPDEWQELKNEFEFRVGGRELVIGKHKSGVVSTFDCRYYDILDNERLVYAYEMHLGDAKISVSLATIELKAEGTSTRLTMHEDGAYLDGYDDNGGRMRGTEGLLDQLVAAVANS